MTRTLRAETFLVSLITEKVGVHLREVRIQSSNTWVFKCRGTLRKVRAVIKK